MSVVRFLTDAANIGAFPSPVPAIKCLPKYFADIAPKLNKNPASSTVKRCVPFLDAMSNGFIIPMWADVFVIARDGNLHFEFPQTLNMQTSISSHSYEQISDHPMSDTPYGKIPMKFHNPWIVETDAGVSCLFTSPMNHMETKLKILDGVVDTDTYYNHVNLPFIWTGGDGEFYIRKGTPLVHVIPFVRTQFECNVSAIDAEKNASHRSVVGSVLQDAYRNNFWHKSKSDSVAANDGETDQ